MPESSLQQNSFTDDEACLISLLVILESENSEAGSRYWCSNSIDIIFTKYLNKQMDSANSSKEKVYILLESYT
jgi:hypothetical protein